MNEEKKELIAAIAKAIGSMDKLCKASLNKFDNYNFVSIDNFLAATSGVCSENGLVIIQNEMTRETIDKKGKPWLLIEFTFDVFHTSGESFDGLKRSVAVPFNGAQAFGSAQSYALKQFLRSLFQIATGDLDDPDFEPPQLEPPTIKKPTELLTSEQGKHLLELADNLDHFRDQDQFHKFISLLLSKTLAELSKVQAGKLIEFLETKGHNSIDSWPENSRNVYLKSVVEKGAPA